MIILIFQLNGAKVHAEQFDQTLLKSYKEYRKCLKSSRLFLPLRNLTRENIGESYSQAPLPSGS